VYYWITDDEFDVLTLVLDRPPSAQIKILDEVCEEEPDATGTGSVCGLNLNVVSAAIAIHPREVAAWLYRQAGAASPNSASAIALSEIRQHHDLPQSAQVTLAQARGRQGLTLDEACSDSEFSVESLRKIEAGVLRPRPDKLHAIANAYRLPLEVVAAAWATSRDHALTEVGRRARHRRRGR
jgi:hypothetical protein